MKKLYFLLDSRAGILSAKHGGKNISELDEDCERYILLAGSAEACCREANDGNYGDNCVVCNDKWNIQWDWFGENGWHKSTPLPSKVFGRYNQ